MPPHGQAAIDLAKRTGTWSLLADAQNGVVPDDLREQLATDEVAAGHFDAFSPSTKRATGVHRQGQTTGDAAAPHRTDSRTPRAERAAVTTLLQFRIVK